MLFHSGVADQFPTSLWRALADPKAELDRLRGGRRGSEGGDNVSVVLVFSFHRITEYFTNLMIL